MDLDELLNASAPPVTARTPLLRRELDNLVAASEEVQSRRRWPAHTALVGGALVGVLGLGAVASAAGVLPGWPSFSTSSGQTCNIEISVSALQDGQGEPNSGSFSAAEQRESLAEAQTFLADFDYDSVDRQQAIAWWKSEESKVRATQSDPAERPPRLNGDDLEVTAVSRWVIKDLSADLTAHGLDIRAIAIAVGSSGCMLRCPKSGHRSVTRSVTPRMTCWRTSNVASTSARTPPTC